MDLPYTGHKLVTEDGDVIHHIADSFNHRVEITVDLKEVSCLSDDVTRDSRFVLGISVDEARRLATSLLRDCCLIEDGVG